MVRRYGLLIALTAAAVGATRVVAPYLLAVGLRAVAALPIVHAPFPGAALLAESVRPSGVGAMTVFRRYEAPARYRDVVTWYQGKDSLMPVTASVRSGCFQQTFRDRRGIIPGNVATGFVEEVTVCTAGGPVAVTSVTTVRFPYFAP